MVGNKNNLKHKFEKLNNQYYQEIACYKEIIASSLCQTLVDNLRRNEVILIDQLKKLAAMDKHIVKMRISPNYHAGEKLSFVNNYFIFDINDCIKQYMYKFPAYKWFQKRHKDINFKNLIKEVGKKVNYDYRKTNIMEDILNENPKIKQDLINYFNDLGLQIKFNKNKEIIDLDILF